MTCLTVGVADRAMKSPQWLGVGREPMAGSK
jgi:hypothetical protein